MRAWRKSEAYSSSLIQPLLQLPYAIVTTDRIMGHLLQPLRLKCRKFHIKIYVNDLSICDFKLIHYCTKNDVTECVGTQELGDWQWRAVEV